MRTRTVGRSHIYRRCLRTVERLNTIVSYVRQMMDNAIIVRRVIRPESRPRSGGDKYSWGGGAGIRA